MSYNLLSGNVNFAGPQKGTVEDLVDTHTNQAITGSKDFMQLTASTLAVPDKIVHKGDINTYINFANDDFIALTAGGIQCLGIY